MTDALDLDAYFDRIGYGGPREPTLAVLHALHALHLRAIPFENLDVLLQRGVRLDLASIQAKLVAGRRGGYCFEQNGLFLAVLQALGFDAVGLSARVQWGRPEAAASGQTHMLIRVDLAEGPFLADVGFGGVTLSAPIRLESDSEQDTGRGVFRLVPAGDELQLQIRLPAGWTRIYQLSLKAQQAIDYELANWFVSTHPDSVFTANLMAAWMDGTRRYGLHNNQLSVYDDEGLADRRTLTPAELEAMLHDTFGLARPDGEAELAALYAGLCPPSSSPGGGSAEP